MADNKKRQRNSIFHTKHCARKNRTTRATLRQVRGLMYRDKRSHPIAIRPAA